MRSYRFILPIIISLTLFGIIYIIFDNGQESLHPTCYDIHYTESGEINGSTGKTNPPLICEISNLVLLYTLIPLFFVLLAGVLIGTFLQSNRNTVSYNLNFYKGIIISFFVYLVCMLPISFILIPLMWFVGIFTLFIPILIFIVAIYKIQKKFREDQDSSKHKGIIYGAIFAIFFLSPIYTLWFIKIAEMITFG